MTTLKSLMVRCTPEFAAHIRRHMQEVDWRGSVNDYVLTAIVEKMRSESDADIPAPKAPHGVRMDSVPEGWLSRLYRDRYELVVDETGRVRHLHELNGIVPFPHREYYWWDEINHLFVQANVYVHRHWAGGGTPFDELEAAQFVYQFVCSLLSA